MGMHNRAARPSANPRVFARPPEGALRLGWSLSVWILVGCSDATPVRDLGSTEPRTDAARPATASSHPTTDLKQDAGPSSSAGSFAVQIRDDSGPLTSLALPCDGTCVSVRALAVNGVLPVSFVWEDGSTSIERKLCGDAPRLVSVKATDSGDAVVGEFHREMQTVSTQLETQVLACMDGGSSDAGYSDGSVAAIGPFQCEPYVGERCVLDGGAALPADVEVTLDATVQYFAGGASLPQGRYRISYVDGCCTAGSPTILGSDAAAADWGIGWAVNTQADTPGPASVSLFDESGKALLVAPGLAGSFTDEKTAFSSYAACVAANCKEPPKDFDFAGGKLGIARDLGGAAGAVDDSPGELAGGRNPTFRLSRVDACL